MVAVIFCTETSRHVNHSVSNQHWTSSSKPLQWIQCAEKIHIQMLNLSCLKHCAPTFRFLRTFLCNLRRWSCTFDICLANIFLKTLTNIFCLLPSLFASTVSVPDGPLSGHILHLKHFEASASLCVVNGILLDIGRNLWHSLVLQSQISNFACSLKSSVSCVKLFSLNNFILSLNEAPKAHYFCFLLLIQRSAVQQKSNKATLPNTKSFFYCKTRVVRTIAMFIASQ